MSESTTPVPPSVTPRVRASTIKGQSVRGADPDLDLIIRGEFTKQQVVDPFRSSYTAAPGANFNTIAPPMNPYALLRMVNDSGVLKQAIEAMVTNVSGHGYRLEYVGPEGAQDTDEAMAEKVAVEALMNYPNDEYSMLTLRKRVRWDLEATGNAFVECALNEKGQITALWHLPSHLVRITEADPDPVEIQAFIPRPGSKPIRKIKRHFRRYVQIKDTKTVYFKELGDPRPIDPTNGKENTKLKFEDTATAVYHLSIYHGGSIYGLPRWSNALTAIKGAREAELTNLDFFTENAIPAAVLTVSGGVMADHSVQALHDHFTAARGRRSSNRLIVLEVVGDQNAASESGVVPPPKVEMKSMFDQRPNDGTFLDYLKHQGDRIRSCFRLPPIFMGMSSDYSHATAKASYEVAEGQVFGPERVAEDDFINRVVLGSWGFKFWSVRSNPPRISDTEEMLKALTTFEQVGAMTPNVAIGIANEMFDMKIENVADDWGDYPFVVIKALASRGEAVGWEKLHKPKTPLASSVSAPAKPENEITGGGFKPGEDPDAIKPEDAKVSKPDNGPVPEDAVKAASDIVVGALKDVRRAVESLSQPAPAPIPPVRPRIRSSGHNSVSVPLSD